MQKKIKSDFSGVIKLLNLLFGQFCHVPSTGSLQLPQHSWVRIVTAFVFEASDAFELCFYSLVVCANELLFEMPLIPLGSRLLIHSHGALSECESSGSCQGCTAVPLQPSAPHPHCCHTQRPSKVSKAGKFKKHEM